MDITDTSIACNQGGETGTDQVFNITAGSDMTFKWTNVRSSAPILHLLFGLLLRYRLTSGLPITWVLSRRSWHLATEIVPHSRPAMVNGSRSMKVDTRMDSGPLPS